MAVAGAGDAVLVVDDDPKFRALVRSLLERAGLTVEVAVDGEHALAAAMVTCPRLVLLDVCLPRASGYEILRELKDLCGEQLPIIFVSGERVEPYDRTGGLLMGADDYLVKPFDPDELLARVRRSLQRSRGGTKADDPEPDDPLKSLTPREREVLALFAAGRSSKEIAGELVISPRTLSTHVQHILTKLSVHTRTQAVALAHRAGLVAGNVVRAP